MFNALLPERPGILVKPMFGNLGAFVNGNMFMGLFGPAVGLRLPPEDAAKLLEVPGAGPFGPPERSMGGYVSLPLQWRKPNRTTKEWTGRAYDFVATLPPKAAKPTKKAR